MPTQETKSGPRVSVAFAWQGLPMYAARQIRALEMFENLSVTVVGTRPPFPTAEIEAALSQPIHWFDGGTARASWNALLPRAPDIVFSTGWAFPLCKALAVEAKQQGRPVICMVDNRRRNTLRQCVGAIRFRLGMRRRFDRFFVPGTGARRLMRFFGVPDSHVREGLYGADPALFSAATPASRRPKTILFVGQMIERKGVDVLLDGFRRSGLHHEGWRLCCIGDGPLAKTAESAPGCRHVPFSDAVEVSRRLADARVFILPSRDDNWGVSLHEAALSRCLLAASTTVGATLELMPGDSPLKFEPGNAQAICDALRHAAALGPDAIDANADAAHERARHFGPARFAREVAGFVQELTGVTLLGGPRDRAAVAGGDGGATAR
ncbi:MAG: glycosyltransferase family 4 protein [Planctomycetia bacterium]